MNRMTDANQKTTSRRQGFTLIEMLVVIAISSILFFLLLRPLRDAFSLSAHAQEVTAAQDAARTTLEGLTRELNSAVYVSDNDSHPFISSTGGPGIDGYSNFLVIDIAKQDGTSTTAHLYDGKLDIVPAGHETTNGSAALTDPTTGDPINLKPGNGSATAIDNATTFPLKPGGSIIRYFVGLRHPVTYDPSNPTLATAGHYSNSSEGFSVATESGDNTYVFYRAQVTPYTPTFNASNNPNGFKVNTEYFAQVGASDGVPINKADLDDPDFFRYVAAGTDVNWLSNDHHVYTASEASDHNTRVESWVKIAKPVINSPDVDLLLQPHNNDGSIAFDTSGTFNGIAHFGQTHDPLTDQDYPIAKSSITFAPATVSNDVPPAANMDYASVGVPADAADNQGLPYIPTSYSSAGKSWSDGYTITLYPVTGNPPAFDQTKLPIFTISASPGGDVLETRQPPMGSPVPVYDVTTGKSLGNNQFVPLTIHQDTGAIDFNQPALPPLVSTQLTPNSMPATSPPGWPYPDNALNRFWYFGADDLNTGNYATDGIGVGVIDLTKLTDKSGTLATPLAPTDGTAPSAMQVTDAILVPGSLRVYGPDTTPGRDYGNSVLYTEVGPTGTLGGNQYRVDYKNALITFNVDADNPNSQPEKMPEFKNDGNFKPDGTPATPSDPVAILFDYQANLSPTISSPLVAGATNFGITPDNPAAPMLVKVSYQTRDLLDINLGVRIFNSSNGQPQIINLHSQARINNSNR